MDEPVIWSRLTEVFRDTLEDDDITLRPETTAKDVEGWDSVAHIQLLVAIERAFKIRFNTGEVAGLANVGDLVRLLARRVE